MENEIYFENSLTFSGLGFGGLGCNPIITEQAKVLLKWCLDTVFENDQKSLIFNFFFHLKQLFLKDVSAEVKVQKWDETFWLIFKLCASKSKTVSNFKRIQWELKRRLDKPFLRVWKKSKGFFSRFITALFHFVLNSFYSLTWSWFPPAREYKLTSWTLK